MPRVALVLILVLFSLSGVSGLIYQLVWIRALSYLIGGTTFAISTVLAAFMGGLAFGSRFFGGRTDRVRDPLLLYGLLELGIGLLGAFVLVLLPLLKPIYVSLVQWAPAGAPAWKILVAFVAVFPPTFLMGGTLPALSRFLVRRMDRLGRGLGLLYALNTAGAVAGAFLAGFVLIGWLGLARCTALAVALNLAIGLAVLALRQVRPSSLTDPAPAAAAPAPVDGPCASPSEIAGSLLATIFAASGFAALGLEIHWTRALQQFLGNSTYAYGAMLTTFLIGLSAGGWVGGRLADRVVSPGRLLGWVQLCIGLFVLATVPVIWDVLPRLREGAFLSPAQCGLATYVSRRFLVAFGVMALPTFLFGMTLPIVTRIGIRRIDGVGEGVGRLYFANTIGSILGALAAGFVILPALGVKGAILASSVWSAGLGVVAQIGTRPRRALSVAVSAAVAVAIAVAAPAALRSGGAILADSQSPRDRVLFEREDSVAETRVYEKRSGDREMAIDGHEIGGTNRTILQKEKILAHLPMVLVPQAESVLVIGLGSGITLGSLAQYDEIRQLTCVEIVPGVVEGARFFSVFHDNVLQDPRVTLHVGDGIQHLLTSRERYDVISCDSKLNPACSGNARLLSRDYYQLCRERLTDRGVMVQWIVLHTPPAELQMIVRSFTEAFTYAGLFWHSPMNLVFAGSRSPLVLDLERARRFALGLRTFADYRLLDIGDPYVLASMYVAGNEQLRAAAGPGPVNTWERPRLEFSIIAAMMGIASPGQLERQNLAWMIRSLDPRGLGLRGDHDPETLARFQLSETYLLRGYAAGAGIRDLRSGLEIFREGSRVNPCDRRLLNLVQHAGR